MTGDNSDVEAAAASREYGKAIQRPDADMDLVNDSKSKLHCQCQDTNSDLKDTAELTVRTGYQFFIGSS